MNKSPMKALMTPLRRGAAVALFALSASHAHAGIMGDMTQMVMSNATATGTFSTRDRVGVFGGSFTMRSPIQNINLVSFDPPRIDAGCGGVDLYGGSFSFINSQQLVQIFRAVAANAVGLAFKAAVNSISPNLGHLMTEFQTMMQHLNGLAKNSCQLAGLVVDKGEQALGLQVNADGTIAGVQATMFNDAIGSLSSFLKDGNDYLKKAGTVNPKAGNATVKAILNSGASAMLGLAGLGNVDGSTDDASNPNSLNNRILVSLLGYKVVGVPCVNTNAAGVPDTQNPASGATLGTVTCNGPATITLNDIVEGGGQGSLHPDTPLQVYGCSNPQGSGSSGPGIDPQPCTNMQSARLDYPGIRGYVNVALFGNADPSLPPTLNSIVGSTMQAGGSALSTGQRALLQQAGLPLMALMSHARSPEMRQAIARKLSEHMVTCVAASVGESLYRAANGIQQGGDNNLPDEVKQRIELIRANFMSLRMDCLADRRTLEVIQEMNESMKLVSNHHR